MTFCMYLMSPQLKLNTSNTQLPSFPSESASSVLIMAPPPFQLPAPVQEPWSRPGAGFCSHTVSSPTANPVAGIFKTDPEPATHSPFVALSTTTSHWTTAASSLSPCSCPVSLLLSCLPTPFTPLCSLHAARGRL